MLLPDDACDFRPAEVADLDAEVARLQARLRPLTHRASREGAARLLAEVGALEAAVADALGPAEDAFGPAHAAWRAATLEAARLFRWTHREAETEACLAARRLARALTLAARALRPRTIELPVATGLRVDPDAYLRAATQFLASSVRLPTVVIGLRDAGAALSAIVAAGLETGGRSAESLTVRAHGPADERRVRFDAPLARRLALHARASGWFLIVGDGPRRSGASFHAAASALNALGAGDEQIVLFPGALTDGSQFSAAEARRGWGLRRKVTAAAEPAGPAPLPGLGAPIADFAHAGGRQLA